MTGQIRERIGLKLSQELTRRGINRSEFARRIDMKRQFLWQIETGLRPCPDEKKVRAAKELEMSVEELFPEDFA